MTQIQKTPFDIGFEAYCEGRLTANNPFPPGSNDAIDWIAGYNYAYDVVPAL